MNKIYLASPYSHRNEMQRELRWKEVSKFYAKLIKKGNTVYCPIAFHHHIAETCDLPTDAEFWKKQNYAFLEWAEVFMIYCLPGWGDSKGILWEIEIAQNLGKIIEHRIWE